MFTQAYEVHEAVLSLHRHHSLGSFFFFLFFFSLSLFIFYFLVQFSQNQNVNDRISFDEFPKLKLLMTNCFLINCELSFMSTFFLNARVGISRV